MAMLPAFVYSMYLFVTDNICSSHAALLIQYKKPPLTYIKGGDPESY